MGLFISLNESQVYSIKANVPNPKGLTRVNLRLHRVDLGLWDNLSSSELNDLENQDLLNYLGNDLEITHLQKYWRENGTWVFSIIAISSVAKARFPGD